MRKYILLIFICGMYETTIVSAQSTASWTYEDWMRQGDKTRRTKSDSIVYYYQQAVLTAPVPVRSELYRKIGKAYYYYYNLPKITRLNDSSFLYFNKAVETDPQNSYAWLSLGQFYDNIKKTDDALKCYQKATAVNPKNENAWSSLAYWYGENGEPNSSILIAQQWLKELPDSHGAMYRLAVWHETNEGMSDSTVYYYRKLLPDNYAREKMAYYIMSTDKNDTTPLQYFTELSKAWPSAWRHYYSIACYYGNRNEITKSLEFIDKSLKLGMRNREQVNAETYLASVRETKEFREMVGRYENW